MFNFCMCGTAAGYPHKPDCPYPIYRATPAQMADWEDARQELRQAQEVQPLAMSLQDRTAMAREIYAAMRL